MSKNDAKLPTQELSSKPTIGEHLKRAGVSRRDFMTLCSMRLPSRSRSSSATR